MAYCWLNPIAVTVYVLSDRIFKMLSIKMARSLILKKQGISSDVMDQRDLYMMSKLNERSLKFHGEEREILYDTKGGKLFFEESKNG